jgi:hypothetical protein
MRSILMGFPSPYCWDSSPVLVDIRNVLVGESWQVNNNTGQVHVFAFTNDTDVLDMARNLAMGRAARQDSQDKGYVGNQDRLSGRES